MRYVEEKQQCASHPKIRQLPIRNGEILQYMIRYLGSNADNVSNCASHNRYRGRGTRMTPDTFGINGVVGVCMMI